MNSGQPTPFKDIFIDDCSFVLRPPRILQLRFSRGLTCRKGLRPPETPHISLFDYNNSNMIFQASFTGDKNMF